MILMLFTKNLFLLIKVINNILFILKIIKKKDVKIFFLFIFFYIFFNLFFLPTFALCEIDLDLLDRENNTYKGSKIVYETPTDIVTQEELEYAQSVCDTLVRLGTVCFFISFTYYLYLITNY